MNGTKKRLKTHQKKKRVLKTPESHMSQTETPSGKLGHCTMKKESLYSLPIITTPCKHLNKKEKKKTKRIKKKGRKEKKHKEKVHSFMEIIWMRESLRQFK